MTEEITKQVLNIPSPEFKRARITIRGRELICARAPDSIKPPPGSKKRGRKTEEDAEAATGSPEDQWQKSVYMMPDGRFGFPSAAIVRCSIDTANTFFPSPTNPKYGIRREVVSGAIDIIGDDLLPLTFEGDPVKRHDIGRNKRGMLIDVYRQSFRNWSLTFVIDFDPAILPMEKLIAILKQAGFSTGIGAWRPQRGGKRGRFSVDPEIPELQWTPDGEVADAA